MSTSIKRVAARFILKSDAESIPVSSCGIAIFTISESKTDHEFLVHLLAFLKLDKGST